MPRFWILTLMLLIAAASWISGWELTRFAGPPTHLEAEPVHTMVLAATADQEQDTASLAPLETMDDYVQQWISQLSANDTFQTWQQATWQKHSLGPGQHGWIIEIQNDQLASVGYLIIHAVPSGGWTLSEYGLGASPIEREALDSLLQSLAQDDYHLQRLNMYYGSPFEAVWNIVFTNREHALVDARSLDLLGIEPLNPDNKLNQILRGVTRPGKLESIVNSPIPLRLVEEGRGHFVDPYESLAWTKMNGEVLGVEQVIQKISHARWLSIMTVYEDWLVPMSVSQWHCWDSTNKIRPACFFAADIQGTRFMPAEEWTHLARWISLDDV